MIKFSLLCSVFLWIIFCLFVLFLLTIVLSVILGFTSFDYPIGISHSIVCPLIYGFGLSLWYLDSLCIGCPSIYSSHYPFGIFTHCALVVLQFIASHYPFGIFTHCALVVLQFILLITLLVSSHIVHWLSFNLFFSLPFWYLHTLCIGCPSIYSSHYPFGIFTHCALVVLQFSLLITLLVSSHIVHWLSFNLFFSLPFWYLHTLCIGCPQFILLITLLVSSHIVHWLSFNLLLLITLLVSSHIVHWLSFNLFFSLPFWYLHTLCIGCPSIYCFSLPFWYLHTLCIGCPSIYSSHYPFGIFTHCALVVLQFILLITLLVSSHIVHWLSFNLFFSLPFWYLHTLCIGCPSIYSSHYPFGIFTHCALVVLQFILLITLLVSSHIVHWLSFDLLLLTTLLVSSHIVHWLSFDLLLLTTLLVSSHIVHWLSFDLFFSLPFWYFHTLYCLFFDLPLLITPLKS